MNLPLILAGQSRSAKTEAINGILVENNLKLEHPDVLVLSEKLGIEAVKKIKEFIGWKPTMAKKRLILIDPADSLTMDAQNGLLKILEEPADSTLIVMTIDKADGLLPTVLSRCEVRVLDFKMTEVDVEEIKRLLAKEVSERLQELEKIEDRKELFNGLMVYYYQKIGPEVEHAEIAKVLLESEEWVKQNVPVKAVLEYLMLKLPKATKI